MKRRRCGRLEVIDPARIRVDEESGSIRFDPPINVKNGDKLIVRMLRSADETPSVVTASIRRAPGKP